MILALYALVAAQSIAAAIVLRRLARGRARPRPLRGGTRAAPGSVSIVIPARNEALRIGPLLTALQGCGPAVAEVIVVDDRSTDATRAVVLAHATANSRLRLLEGTPLAAGWVGKQHALQQGLAAAASPWTLCLDADAQPSADLPDALVLAAAAHSYEVLTAGPRFALGSAWEEVLHPALLATLVYRFGPPTLAAAANEHMIANGQCLLVPTERFRRAGGWQAVASHMTEDVALARHLVRTGWRLGMVNAADLLAVDMHDSAAEAWREWGRSLALPGVASGREQVIDITTLVLTLALAPWTVLAALLLGSPLLAIPGAILLTVRFIFHAALRSAYDDPTAAYWLAPFADGLAVVRLVVSAVRPNRRWRGRSYPQSR